MRLSTIEGIVAMPIVFMSMPGNFIVANLATETLGIAKSSYGIIASLPAWCNVIQLLLFPILSRKFSQKSISLAFCWFHIAAWTILAISLPHLPRDGSLVTVLFMISIYGLISVAFAIVNISWTSWVQEWLPRKARGKYLGRRNRFAQGSVVIFLILAGICIKQFSAIDPVRGFQLLIGIGIALRVLSISWQQKIYEVGNVEKETNTSLLAQFKIIYSDKPLMRFIMFGVAFNFLANFVGPFFPVFMYKTLDLGVDQVGFIITISTVTGALSMPKWGVLSDKYGCRPILSIALIGWMVNGYLWAFTTPDRAWLVYLVFATGGIFGAGFLFGSFSMILKLVPPKAKSAAISVNLAMSSLAGASSAVLGGNIIQWAEARYEDKLAVFHTLSNIHHTVILATVFILLSVKEPKSSTLLHVAGAMRSFKQVGSVLGLSFLGNYSFFNKNKENKH